MQVNPEFRRKLEAVYNNYELFGLMRTLGDIGVYLLSTRADDFDAEHGVATAGVVMPCDSGITDASALDGAIAYVPTDRRVMEHVLRNLARHLDPSAFTFVDLGCGRGRAVLIATQLPFREVVGVELSPEHCEVARKNVEVFSARSSSMAVRSTAVRIVQADATKFEYPAGNLLVYLYNPFRPTLFRVVLDRLAALQRQEGRRVVVALSAPRDCEHLLARHPRFVELKRFSAILASYSWSLWECAGAGCGTVTDEVTHTMMSERLEDA